MIACSLKFILEGENRRSASYFFALPVDRHLKEHDMATRHGDDLKIYDGGHTST